MAATIDFLGLEATADPMRWRFPLHRGVMTARGALYGGAGLAAVIAALEPRHEWCGPRDGPMGTRPSSRATPGGVSMAG